MIKTPSGAVFEHMDEEVVRHMARCGFVTFDAEPHVLAGGTSSHLYVRGREDLTDNVPFAWDLGTKIAHFFWRLRASKDTVTTCLIGVPLGGNAIAQAAAMASGQPVLRMVGNPIIYRLMREAKKEHGPHRTWVAGTPDYGSHEYWLLENTVTTGTSVLRAAERIAEDGYVRERLGCLVLVDRGEGGVERLNVAGFREVKVVYKLMDILFVFGKLHLWPPDKVAAACTELRVRQGQTA